MLKNFTCKIVGTDDKKTTQTESADSSFMNENNTMSIAVDATLVKIVVLKLLAVTEIMKYGWHFFGHRVFI